MSDQETKEIVEVKDETIRESLARTVELLKKKVASLQERNRALVAECKAKAVKLKEQSIALTRKPVAIGKALYNKVSNKSQEKHFIFTLNNQSYAVTGIEVGRKGDRVAVYGVLSKYDLMNNCVEETILNVNTFEFKPHLVILKA